MYTHTVYMHGDGTFELMGIYYQLSRVFALGVLFAFNFRLSLMFSESLLVN